MKSIKSVAEEYFTDPTNCRLRRHDFELGAEYVLNEFQIDFTMWLITQWYDRGITRQQLERKYKEYKEL